MLRRLVLILAVTLPLAGCGFRPLYGSFGANPGAQRIFASIYVAPIESANNGYELRNALIDILQASQRAEGTVYQLNVELQESRTAVAIQPNAAITRYNYQLDASYTLINTHNAEVVTSGKEEALSAYNVLPSSPTAEYGTLAARRDAQQRAAQDIAERIRLALGVYFARATQPKS